MIPVIVKLCESPSRAGGLLMINYDESGLPSLLEENYYQPKSQLEPYTEQLKALFKKQLPHTVNQAIEMIDKETGIRLKPSACRAFLRK